MQGVPSGHLEEGAQGACYGSVEAQVSYPAACDVEELRINVARVDGGSHIIKRRRIVASALAGLSACAVVLGIVRSSSDRGNTAALLGRKYASAGECITESCPTPLLAGLFEHPVDVAAAMRCTEGAKPGASAADSCAEDLESLGSTGSNLAACGRCSGCLAGTADDAACASAVSFAAVSEEEAAAGTAGRSDEGNQAAKLAAVSDCVGLKCYGSAARVGLHDGKHTARSLWGCLKDSGSDADAAKACFDSTPSISDSPSARQLRACSECAGCLNGAASTANGKDPLAMAACDVPNQSFSAILKESSKTDTGDDDVAAAADDDDAGHSFSTGDDKDKPIDDKDEPIDDKAEPADDAAAAAAAGQEPGAAGADADDVTSGEWNATAAPTLAPMEPEEPRVWDCLGLSCSKALADMAMLNPWDMIDIFKCMDAAGSNTTLGALCFDEVNSTVPAVVTFETCALCHGCIEGTTPSVEICEQTPSTYMPIGATPGTNGWTMGSGGVGAAVFDYSKYMDYSQYMPGANGGIPMDYSKFMDYSQYMPAGIVAGGGGGTGANGAYFDWTAMAGGQQVGGEYGKPLPFRPAPAASAPLAGNTDTGMTRLDAAAGDDGAATAAADDDKAATATAPSDDATTGQQPQQKKQPQQPEQPQQVPPLQVPFYGQQPQQVPMGPGTQGQGQPATGYRGPPHGELPPSEWQKYAMGWFPGQQAQQPLPQRPMQLDAETPADDVAAADSASTAAAQDGTVAAGDVKEAQAPEGPEQASQPQQLPQPQQRQQPKQPEQPEQPEQPQQVFQMPQRGQLPQFPQPQQPQQPQIGQQAEQPQLPPSVWKQYATGWFPGQQAQQPLQQRPIQLDAETPADGAAAADSASAAAAQDGTVAAGDVKEAQAPEGPEQASQPQQLPQPQQPQQPKQPQQPEQPEQPEQPQQVFQMPQRGQLPQPQQPQQPQIGQQAEQPQLPPSVWKQYAMGWFPGQQVQQQPLPQQRPMQLDAEKKNPADDAAAEDAKTTEGAAEPLPGWSQWMNAGQGQGAQQGQPGAAGGGANAGGGYYDWSKWSGGGQAGGQQPGQQQQAPGAAAAGAPTGGNAGGYDWSQYANGQGGQQYGGQQYGGQPGADAGGKSGATQLIAEAPEGPQQAQKPQQPQQGVYDWSKWAAGQQVSGQYGISPAAAAVGQTGVGGGSVPQAGGAYAGGDNAGAYDWSKWASGQQVSGQNGISPAAAAAGQTQLAARVPEDAEQAQQPAAQTASMGAYDWSKWAGGQQAGGQAGAAAGPDGGYDWSQYAGAMGQGGQAGAGGAADWSKWAASGGQQSKPSAPGGDASASGGGD